MRAEKGMGTRGGGKDARFALSKESRAKRASSPQPPSPTPTPFFPPAEHRELA
jgi:hypothetical protein